VIVLGLILVLLSLGAGAILFLATDSIDKQTQMELAGYSWGMTPLAMLITGAIVMLLLWLGLALIRGSVKRRRRPAREAKEAERQAKIEESIRADERARAEEQHQSALAERDRVRDEEFQSRLAERDREREREFAIRQQEAEEQARAFERSRVEQELARRQSTTGGGTAAAAVGAGAGFAADEAGHSEHFHQPEPLDQPDHVDQSGHVDQSEHVAQSTEATGDDFAGRHSADAPADSGAHDSADRSTGSSVWREDTSADAASSAAAGDGVDDPRTDVDAGDDRESQEHHRPAFRTVADKLMGRDPADRE
jgi:hypothetical protein